MRRAWVRLLAVCVLDCLATAVVAAPAPARPSVYVATRPLPPDPAVRMGVLPNGVRYAVTHVEAAHGVVSLRLGIDVGSYEESDAERGLAHFIEHMAFRATRSFPDNSVEAAFAPKGVAFGRDHNAATGMFATRFQLDMPGADDGEITEGFRWLRDVADGVVFTPAGVDVERGVVLAEKSIGHTVADDAELRITRFNLGDLRSVERDPIGLEPVIRAATPGQLEAFYRRWYRPENAVVTMASSLSVDEMETRIRTSFGSWTSEGPPPTRAPVSRPKTDRAPDATVVVEKTLISRVDVCRVSAADGKDPQDLEHLRRAILRDAWLQTLNVRLEALRLDPKNHLVLARAETGDAERDHRLTCLSVAPAEQDWAPALASAENELLRFLKAGPTELEFEKAIESVRARIRGAITSAPNRGASELSAGLLDLLLNRDYPVADRERMKAFDLAVEQLGPDDIRAAFARDWSGSGPLIDLISATPQPADPLRVAWETTARSAGLGAYVDGKTAVWGYDFRPKGVVTSRVVERQGDFVRLQFKNGLVFNFKHTAFQKDAVSLRITFGHGRREVDNHDFLMAGVAGAVVAAGGVGKHSVEDIAGLFEGDPQKFSVKVGTDVFDIATTVYPANLKHSLTVLAAYMTDPAFRPSLDPLLRKAIEMLEHSVRTSLQLNASLAALKVVAPNSPIAMPSNAELEAVDTHRLAAILAPSMTRDPIEVTIVGDIDEKDAVDLVASTFGALPPRLAPMPKRADTFFLTYPPDPPPLIEANHEGPADQGLGQLLWPLYVATPARRREEYAIVVLAAVFNDALRHRIRNELGKTYAPQVGSSTPDFADQGTIEAEVEAAPADVPFVMGEARALALRLAAGEISAAQLDAARAPMLVAAERSLTDNADWADALSAFSIDPRYVDDYLFHGADLRAVTLDEVKAAATRWLSKPPYEVRVLPHHVAEGGGS